jgi:hypothetical protein
MAEFLRGFDRAVQAVDTKKPENPVAVRDLLAERIRKSWNYKRLGREKGMTSESHPGDALNAMFYQPHRIANRGHPSIPNNWEGLDPNMPTLVGLAVSAPTSGYIAILFLNLIQSSPKASLLPFLVQAIAAWCGAYGVDTNFWSEKGFGVRVCDWLDQTFTADSSSAAVLATVEEDLSVRQRRYCSRVRSRERGPQFAVFAKVRCEGLVADLEKQAHFAARKHSAESNGGTAAYDSARSSAGPVCRLRLSAQLIKPT